MTAVLEASGLRKSFAAGRSPVGRTTRWVHAVKEVSLQLSAGETLAVLGETGAGKSTVGRLLTRLEQPDDGTVEFNGADISRLSGKDLLGFKAKVRMIFQDPFSSFDPRAHVGESVAEPLRHFSSYGRRERRDRVVSLFESVGLTEGDLGRYPRHFSGGQLQRIAIARAIAPDPAVVVCDEPVAALDMSVRAQVINLLKDLQAERGIALVFISHDLSLVQLIADRVLVMYRGRVVESGPCADVLANPRHPYTQELVRSVPVPDPRRRRADRPAARYEADEQVDLTGCDYANRCRNVFDTCLERRPPLEKVQCTEVACHLVHQNSNQT